MAKRKATRRTQRKARGGATGLAGATITPAKPGISITYSNDIGMEQTIYIGPPSEGGAGGSDLAKDIGEGSSEGRA
ncbi:MAG: hypothetical protein KR126chlam3_01553 [Chlamydiae bacterium]|nr:hypothetical protein [Chlamydiota bacterium]